MSWLDPVQALVLLLVGAGATYLSQRRLQEIRGEREQLKEEQAQLHAAEARLRDERLKIYAAVLDPYIEVLHEVGRGLQATEANRRLGSADHRKAAFQLKIVGSDNVVRAFNAFTRYIVDSQRTGQERPGEILRRWAALVFAIRRNIGEVSTGLTEPDMIVDWVADIETVYPELGPRQILGPDGGVSVGTDSPVGTFARVAGREISMHRLEELRVLAAKFRDREITDDELVELFARLPDAPGAEIMLDPEAHFAEGGERLDVPSPRDFLDAIERRTSADRELEPKDDELLMSLIKFLKGLRGRRVSVVQPRLGQSFEIRA